jgi:hypothetical protein
MTLLKGFTHKQPPCYYNFQGPDQPFLMMGSLGLELSMGPAVAEVTLGAGALPKEISMGLLGLAEWLDRWTVFESESHDYEAGRSGRAPCCSSVGGSKAFFRGDFCCKSLFPCICFLVS